MLRMFMLNLSLFLPMILFLLFCRLRIKAQLLKLYASFDSIFTSGRRLSGHQTTSSPLFVIFIFIILQSFQQIIIMRLLRPLIRYCSNSKSLANLKHFTEIQSKQMILKPNYLRETILQHIEQFGEMQIQRYWKIALTDPQFGYYGSKNVFSREGDFTTSPEISPLFGEIFGVWIAYFLKKTGIFNQQTDKVQKRFRIVELGGGRGYFIKDILRSLSDLKINNDFQVTFIEVSQYNRKAQQDSLLDHFKTKNHFFKFEHEKATQKCEYFTSENPDKNVNLTWVQSIEDLYFFDTQNEKNGKQVPFTIFVMNQFMDALPISVLRYTENGWKQKVLVKGNNQDLQLDLKVSNRQLPEKMTPIAENPQIGSEIEVSPLSLLTMDLMAKTISKYGGAILNTDYGDEGAFQNSIRAIKNHKFIQSPYFWQMPGECDLSAYVNFKALADFAEKNQGIVAYEAIPQGYFLQAMGIVPRVDLLKKNMSEQQQKRIQSEYQRLVAPQEMGQIYKVQIITKKQYGQIYPHVDQDNQYSF